MRLPLLGVSAVSVRYGGIEALRQVDLEVYDGEIVSLIGANGAGKSTLLKAISGSVPVSGGKIEFKGRGLNSVPAHLVVRRGVVHVPEGRNIFSRLSVRENLDIGAYFRRDKAAIAASLRQVYELFPRLADRARQAAGTLSGGEQQMLAIGRGLMGSPSLLLLDEPSMGIAPLLVREIFAQIAKINAAGTAILLVEQNANAAFSLADRSYLLRNGMVVKSGQASELKSDPAIQNAYLGID